MKPKQLTFTMDDLGLMFADGVRFGQQHPNANFGNDVEATQDHRNAFDDAANALIVNTLIESAFEEKPTMNTEPEWSPVEVYYAKTRANSEQIYLCKHLLAIFNSDPELVQQSVRAAYRTRAGNKHISDEYLCEACNARYEYGGPPIKVQHRPDHIPDPRQDYIRDWSRNRGQTRS